MTAAAAMDFEDRLVMATGLAKAIQTLAGWGAT